MRTLKKNTIENLIELLREMEKKARYRSNILFENGQEYTDADRARALATAEAYNFVVIMLREFDYT